MFDAEVAKIQVQLAKKLPWLKHAFGICERLTTMKDGKRFNSANAFIGDRYVQVMPCRELGNFCFFALKDPQTYWDKDTDVIFAPFSLIFWYKVDECSSSPDMRNAEAVKSQILSVLDSTHFGGSIFTLNRIYERAENVFSDYSYELTDNQYMMHPYAGLRIEGELRANVPCFTSPINRGAFNEAYNESYDIKK